MIIESFNAFSDYKVDDIIEILYYKHKSQARVIEVKQNEDGSNKITVQVLLH